MNAYILLGVLAGISNLVFGGPTAFNFKRYFRAYLHAFFLLIISFGAAVILARHDDALTSSFTWDQDTLKLIFAAELLGIVGGIAVSFITDWVVEEIACRKVRNSPKTPTIGDVVRDLQKPVPGLRQVGHLISDCNNSVGGNDTFCFSVDHDRLIELGPMAPAMYYEKAGMTLDRDGRNLDIRS